MPPPTPISSEMQPFKLNTKTRRKVSQLFSPEDAGPCSYLASALHDGALTCIFGWYSEQCFHRKWFLEVVVWGDFHHTIMQVLFCFHSTLHFHNTFYFRCGFSFPFITDFGPSCDKMERCPGGSPPVVAACAKPGQKSRDHTWLIT